MYGPNSEAFSLSHCVNVQCPMMGHHIGVFVILSMKKHPKFDGQSPTKVTKCVQRIIVRPTEPEVSR